MLRYNGTFVYWIGPILHTSSYIKINKKHNIYLLMSKLFGQKLFLKKILYIFTIFSKQMHLIALLLTERKFCEMDALENFDYKPLFMFQVNLGSDLFFSEGTV